MLWPGLMLALSRNMCMQTLVGSSPAGIFRTYSILCWQAGSPSASVAWIYGYNECHCIKHQKQMSKEKGALGSCFACCHRKQIACNCWFVKNALVRNDTCSFFWNLANIFCPWCWGRHASHVYGLIRHQEWLAACWGLLTSWHQHSKLHVLSKKQPALCPNSEGWACWAKSLGKTHV